MSLERARLIMKPVQQSTPGQGYVLVVDDEPAVRSLLQAVLEDEGMQVEAVADGASAIQVAAAREPSLVILDLHLPVLAGTEVAARLSALYDSVPLIILTGDEGLADALLGRTATAYLRKPFDLDDLLAAVRTALQGERTR
jgi:DNA-binding response OmpR family regulator